VKCYTCICRCFKQKQCQHWEQWQWFASFCHSFVKDLCLKLAYSWQLRIWFNSSEDAFGNNSEWVTQRKDGIKTTILSAWVHRYGSTSAAAVVESLTCLYFIECKFWILNVKQCSPYIESVPIFLRVDMYFADFVPKDLPRGSLIRLLWFDSQNNFLWSVSRVVGSGDLHIQPVVQLWILLVFSRT
jgi:hypothetical protein